MLYGILEISIDLFGCQCAGGDERIRTADPLLAKQVLSQLSYIPWGTRAISGARINRASLRMRRSHLRGRLSDLESLKSGKDRTRPWVLFVCLHSNETKRDGFSPRTEPPPCHLSTTDLALSGQLIFATRNSKSLLFTDLIAFVTAKTLT